MQLAGCLPQNSFLGSPGFCESIATPFLFSQEMTVEDFQSGIRRLRGEAKAKEPTAPVMQFLGRYDGGSSHLPQKRQMVYKANYHSSI